SLPKHIRGNEPSRDRRVAQSVRGFLRISSLPLRLSLAGVAPWIASNISQAHQATRGSFFLAPANRQLASRLREYLTWVRASSESGKQAEQRQQQRSGGRKNQGKSFQTHF